MSDDDKGQITAPYQPPYGSPIEDAVAWSLAKYLSCRASLHKQYEVETICGQFRLDFAVISQSGYRVGYECDGEDYHDEWRDEWRDAMILGDGLLDAIIRFRGTDIALHLNDILYIASRWDPVLFSDRGRSNLHTLAAREARGFYAAREPYEAFVTYSADEEGRRRMNPAFVLVQRRCGTNVRGTTQFWCGLYSYAKGLGGGDLDSVIAAYQAKTKAEAKHNPFPEHDAPFAQDHEDED